MNSLIKLIVPVFLMTTATFFAQKKQNREAIKSLKVAFITERLNLTSKEAEVFWPVYNAHELEIEALRKRERLEIRSKLRNADELTEAESDKLLQIAIGIESEKAKLQLEYFEDIGNTISSKKTILLIKAEEDFKRRLIKQYRNKRGKGGRR